MDLAKKSGTTPFFMAAQKGFLPALAMLATGGADVDRASNKGWSPLMVAANEKGHAETVAFLLDCGAKKGSRLGGKTAHDFALQHGGFPQELLARLKP